MVAKFVRRGILTPFPVTDLVFQKTDFTYRHIYNIHDYPETGWTYIDGDNSIITYTNITQLVGEIPGLFIWFPGCDAGGASNVDIKSGYDSANHFGFLSTSTNAPTNSCPAGSFCHLSNAPFPDSYDCGCSVVNEKLTDWETSESRDDWFTAAATYETGFEPIRAIDGDMGTCWKAETLSMGREAISSIRISPTSDISSSKVRGVKVYIKHWTDDISVYEGMSVTVSRWSMPGTSPQSATHIDATTNGYKYADAVLSGYCDEYLDGTFTRSSNDIHPGGAAINWYQGDEHDHRCGKTNADPYYGLQDTIPCGFVQAVIDGESNYNALHFHCEDPNDPDDVSLLGHVVQIDSRDSSSFDPVDSIFAQFDFEICEVELIPNVRCQPRPFLIPDCNPNDCDPIFPANCVMEERVISEMIWDMKLVNSNDVLFEKVDSTSCGYEVPQRKCDCGQNHLEQPNSDCSGFPNYDECAGTPEELCEDRNECEHAYNSYYKDFVWHGQGVRTFGTTRLLTNIFSNITGGRPREGKPDLSYQSSTRLSISVHGDGDLSDFHFLFDGDSDTSQVFDGGLAGPAPYQKGYNFRFDDLILLDKIEVVIPKANFDSYTMPGLSTDWTENVMQLFSNVNNDPDWHTTVPSPTVFSPIVYGQGC